MRGTALREVYSIREQIGVWEGEHTRRLDLIRSVIRAVELVKQRLPELARQIRASAEVLLRRYRETNYATRRKSGESGLALKYAKVDCEVETADVQTVLDEAKETESVIIANQAALAKFRELFETEVAERLTKEIERIEDTSRETLDKAA